MLPSAQLIIIELGCLDICNRNMRKFVVKYNQMECSCKRTSCFGNKMYYFGLLAFRLICILFLIHRQERLQPRKYYSPSLAQPDPLPNGTLRKGSGDIAYNDLFPSPTFW